MLSAFRSLPPTPANHIATLRDKKNPAGPPPCQVIGSNSQPTFSVARYLNDHHHNPLLGPHDGGSTRPQEMANHLREWDEHWKRIGNEKQKDMSVLSDSLTDSLQCSYAHRIQTLRPVCATRCRDSTTHSTKIEFLSDDADFSWWKLVYAVGLSSDGAGVTIVSLC